MPLRRSFFGTARFSLFVTFALAPLSPGAHAISPQVVVGWNDPATGTGMIGAVSTQAPWQFAAAPLTVDPNPQLRYAFGKLYVVSPDAGTIRVVNPETWSIENTFNLGSGSGPLDIAVVHPGKAFIARSQGDSLLRLDLTSGATEEVVDLSGLADPDGVPDLGTMAIHEGRLFVQVRRLNQDEVAGYLPPSYLAVVDLASERLIDTNPLRDGVQPIELAGTFAKHKMQLLPETSRLLVSATGGPFDEGGIEAIDLERLQSAGLVVREADGLTGADLGPFVMTSPESGFLSFTTDLTISSHLHGFTSSGAVLPDPLHVAVDYLAPALEYDPATGLLFFPQGGGVEQGLHVFEATTGRRLTDRPIMTSGAPTDLVLVSEPVTFALAAWFFAAIWRIRRNQCRMRRPPDD